MRRRPFLSPRWPLANRRPDSLVREGNGRRAAGCLPARRAGAPRRGHRCRDAADRPRPPSASVTPIGAVPRASRTTSSAPDPGEFGSAVWAELCPSAGASRVEPRERAKRPRACPVTLRRNPSPSSIPVIYLRADARGAVAPIERRSTMCPRTLSDVQAALVMRLQLAEHVLVERSGAERIAWPCRVRARWDGIFERGAVCRRGVRHTVSAASLSSTDCVSQQRRISCRR